MAINDGVLGTLFQDILEDNDQAIELAKVFSNSNKSPQIVSPTVAGLLKSFDKTKFSNKVKIDGCNIDYLEDFSNPYITTEEDADEESLAIIKEISNSASSFVNKVSEIRSSYLPKNNNNYAAFYNSEEASSKQSTMESYENAFMRMLGMPSDADIPDENAKLIYISPASINLKDFKKKVTNIKTVRGPSDGAPLEGDEYADILRERSKPIVSNGDRKFQYSDVLITNFDYNKKIKEIADKLRKINDASSAETKTDEKISEEFGILSYNNPFQLFRFYYLKSIPLQDESIYGCIIEPSKIVLKPFDSNASVTVNGIKPKTSLLETIIRIRLDRISGAPGIYPGEPVDPSSDSLKKALNVGTDKITEVECFLIQKLRKILYVIAQKYINDTTEVGHNILKTAVETGSMPAKTPEEKNKGSDGSAEDANSEGDPKYNLYVKSEPDLTTLEMLKAREDSILFLLKDTSSSYNLGSSAAMYSAIDLQEGAIRTASGFDDVLSGPLYSLLSFKSQYIEKIMIKKKEELDNKNAGISTDSGNGISDKSSTGLKKNPNSNSYTYLGISSEDFIVYTISLLALNQDYLIGLLPQENRRNLANTISGSIMGGKSKRNDPYGILERLDKSPNNGGFPTVADSVNALSLIVSKLYEEYMSYVRCETDEFYDKLIELQKQTKSSAKKE